MIEKISAEQGSTAASDVSILVETPNHQTSFSITLPVSAINQLVNAGVNQFEIKNNLLRVNMNANLMAQLSSDADNRDIILQVNKVPTSQAIKSVTNGRSVFNVQLAYQGNEETTPISNLNGNQIKIEIPYTLAKGENAERISVFYIDEEGKVCPSEGSYYDKQTKSVIVETTDLNVYGIMYQTLAQPEIFKTVVSKANGSIRVAWSIASGADGYQVYRANSKNGEYKLVATVSRKNLSYTDRDVKGSQTYYYKVRPYENVSDEKIYGSFTKTSKATASNQTSKR